MTRSQLVAQIGGCALGVSRLAGLVEPGEAPQPGTAFTSAVTSPSFPTTTALGHACAVRGDENDDQDMDARRGASIGRSAS